MVMCLSNRYQKFKVTTTRQHTVCTHLMTLSWFELNLVLEYDCIYSYMYQYMYHTYVLVHTVAAPGLPVAVG